MKKIFLFASFICLLSCSGKSAKNNNVNTTTQADSADEFYNEETGILPRTVLGCTLGETSISQAKKILKSQGYNAWELKEDGCASLAVEKEFKYAGHKWERGLFMFLDGSLIRVWLDSPEADLTYAKKLYDQYGDNYCIQKDHDIYLNDDRTSFRYHTSDPGEWESIIMTVTDFERNDLLPIHKDEMEL